MDFTKVRDFLNSLSGIGIPGADLAIYQNGREIFRHQTGFSDLEAKTPITPETLYPFYSMTKIITCVAALRLYEEGRFLLTDPLHKYLPEFKEMKVKPANSDTSQVPAKNPIRIVDLFTMSTGFSYDVTENLSKLFQHNYTVKEFISAISKDALYFEPGTRFRYGFSHDILAGLIEVLSGKTLGEYFRDNILAPLGMEDTFFIVPKEKQHRFVTCYTYSDAEQKHKRSEKYPGDFFNPGYKYESGGGGLVSTVDDYAKFANTLCAGGTAPDGYRLLAKGTIDLMRTNHLDAVGLKDFYAPQHAGYGYGLGVKTMLDPAAGGSNSMEGYGWAGFAGTYVRIDPSMGLVFVYAQHLVPSREDYVYPRLRNIIYGCM